MGRPLLEGKITQVQENPNRSLMYLEDNDGSIITITTNKAATMKLRRSAIGIGLRNIVALKGGKLKLSL